MHVLDGLNHIFQILLRRVNMIFLKQTLRRLRLDVDIAKDLPNAVM